VHHPDKDLKFFLEGEEKDGIKPNYDFDMMRS
jgi:hypothetical protein